MSFIAFITDPYFGYKLLASIILFIVISLMVGWGIYFLLGKTKLKQWQRVLVTIVTVVIGITVGGIISEQLGL